MSKNSALINRHDFPRHSGPRRIRNAFLPLAAAVAALLLSMVPAASAQEIRPPASFGCESMVGQVDLGWRPVSGAVAYDIWRADGGGAFAFVGQATDSHHADYPPADVTFDYYVTSVYAGGQISEPSEICRAAAVTVDNLPILAIPRVALDERTLLRIAGLPPAEARTELSVEIDVKQVPSTEWSARLYASVVRAGDGQVAAVARSGYTPVPAGDSVYTETVVVDAEALGLQPGAYTLQAIVILRLGEDPSFNLYDARSLLSGPVEPAMVFATGAKDGLTVLDEGVAELDAYQAAIDSGNPDTAYKGLSAMIGHYRERGQYGLSEAAVNDLVAATADADEFRPLHPIFRFWNVDDRRLAGDYAGAIELLGQVLDTTPPSQRFLGEPFRARGLLELARLHVGHDDFSTAVATLDQLLQEYPGMHRPTTLAERAWLHLELAELGSARSDYQEIVDSYQQCTEMGPEDVPGACPTLYQKTEAERKIRLIDSDRSWYRDDPADIIATLQDAIDSGNADTLDEIASREGFRYALGAGEYHEVKWDQGLRQFLEQALQDSEELSLVVAPIDGSRQNVTLEGLAETAGAGPSRSVVLSLHRSPFGWEWAAVNGLPYASVVNTDGDWDPCSSELDPETGLPECHFPENDPPPPVGGNGTAKLHIQAPWAPGVHMRAGGLQDAIDFATMGIQVIVELVAFMVPLSLTDECGSGVPGYMYGLDTHTGEDLYAIDYTQGVRGFCLWGVCISPTNMVLAELVEVAADQVFDTPTKTPAYGDPVYAAHEGMVVNRKNDWPDGSNDSDQVNRIDLAVWTDSMPLSMAAVSAQVASNAASLGLGATLDTIGADYWLKHLHLRKKCAGQCPTLGMWVRAGEKIGLIDDTGKSFTSHLHFVVRKRPGTDAHRTRNWHSVQQIINGDTLDEFDNGKCIESKNELRAEDRDNDGILDGHDNCTIVANPDQQDIDGDLIGDVCDVDRDNDGLPNGIDSCPDEVGYTDWDGDGTWDSCDPDVDGDGVPNDDDQCAFADDGQDSDGDGIADGCDLDNDGDGWEESCDRDWVFACGCLSDLAPANGLSAGDHDGDGIDSLYDDCPCSTLNPTCDNLIDLPPKGLGGFTQGTWGQPYDPAGPGNPYDPGGTPFGPGGSMP